MDFLELEKKNIELKLKNFFNKKTKELKNLPDCITSGIEELEEFTLNGGKRIRSLLTLIIYYGYKGKNKNIYDLALASELLHSFLLIHDDIIDNDDFRRNKMTCHKALEKKFNKIGVDLAIILGDLAYTFSLQIIQNSKISSNQKDKATKIVLKTIERTCYGEYLDICSQIKNVDEDFIKFIHLYKTSYYTFESPFKLGANLANVNNSEIQKLERLSIFLGLMFQIQDDILGIFGDEKQFGKPIGSDIKEGKKTLLIVKSKSKYIYSKLGKKITKKELQKIKNIMKTSGALDYCYSKIDMFYEKSKKIINNLEMTPKYKKELLDILYLLKYRSK